jgi:hypothetical protein
MNLLEAMDEEALFAPWFRGGDTWLAWRSLIAALFGLPMTPAMLDVFKECTGRSVAPTVASEEGWLVTGRRGGKSRVMALIAVFLACFRSYSAYLAPGERATILVLAADKRQARTVLRYIKGMLEAVPMLRKKVTGETAWSLDLDNSVTIEIGTASFRTSRGYSFAAVICDEIAFWRNDVDAAEPDFEILDAIRPGMATIPGSVLLCASSPYARRGALWDAFKRWYGKDGEPLVWKASTRRMNPTVPQTVIDRAMERDEASARAEYGAEFRTDVEALFTREAVAAVVEPKCLERPFNSDFRYVGFVDPSGGSADSMTLAIAHAEADVAVLDLVREIRPPFSPDEVVKEFTDLLKMYRLSDVTGDRYGGEWPRERFQVHGVRYLLAEQTRSELYLAMLPAVNSRRVSLLDLPRLESQLVNLERRTSRGGRDSVDHAPGGHDDLANAVAGALAGCTAGSHFTHDLMNNVS